MLDLKSNEVLWVTKNMPTGAIEFSPDGQSLLTTDLFGGIVRLWDVQSGVRRMIFSWDGSANEPLHLSLAQMADVIDTQGLNDIHATFNPDGSQILLWGSNGVRFWDIESEKLTVITEVRQNLGIGFNPESDQLITSQANGVQAWDPRTGELLENYLPPFSGFKELVFSPNGRLLATTDYEQKIVLWDTETRKQLFWLLGHEGINAVSSIAFNADGSRLVSGGRDKTIRIWDTESGEELLVFFVEDDISNVAFSPDNTRLFACGLIRKVHIWDTKSKGLVAYERRIARKLANTLTPLVESWIQKASGNNELLFEMLEREIPTRSNEEVIALRNLVTKTITRKNERVQRKTITRQTIEQIGDDPDVLHAFLTGLLTTITVERFGSIADDVLVAATRACELTYFQNPIALFNLSRVHFMMGDHTKAAARFKQIDVLQIDDAQVLNRIAWTTVDSEDMEFFNTVSGTVLLAAQRACTLSNHSNGAILDTLARVHFERGEVSEAIHWQTEAVKNATSNLHDELASTLAKYQAAGDSHEPENPAAH
jgi:tetratricopeptide (TPR) repeat protein